MLSLLQEEKPRQGWDTVFASHQLHEVTMYYPMRVIRTSQYKLILNLNYQAPFPIDQDFAVSPTFLDLLNRTRNHQDTHWFSSLQKYYYRKPFELYDIHKDPHELNNVYNQPEYKEVLQNLLGQLRTWQNITNDPWICAPSAVLEKTGCMHLDNGTPLDLLHHTDL